MNTQDYHAGQIARPLQTTEPHAATANEPVQFALLRHLDPDRLVLYDGGQPDRDDWERHRRQQTDHALIATRQHGRHHHVVGTLEFRLHQSLAGRWGMIDRLYVDRRHRRQGIASGLVAAAIRFARAQRLLALREHIPNILRYEPATADWHPHTPALEGWGGLRSLGATASACCAEGQRCAILRQSDSASATDHQAIGAILELPIAATPAPGPRSATHLLDRLITDLARAAGVPLHQPDQDRRCARSSAAVVDRG